MQDYGIISLIDINEEETFKNTVQNTHFLLLTGTTITSSTNIDQSYIDSNPGPYTIQGGTETNPIRIEIVGSLKITSIDTYFIIDSDYITINCDPTKGYVININNVLLFKGLVSNLKNSNITINGLTIKGTNSTLNDSAGWIVCSEFGIGCTNNKITSCSSYLPIGGRRCGGIVGRNCTADITSCINYGDILLNPNKDSNGLNLSSLSGGICGTVFEGNLSKCINYGAIHGVQSAGIMAGTGNNIIVTDCDNYGIINGLSSSGIVSSIQKNSNYVTTVTVKNCNNNFTAKIVGDRCGGIIFTIGQGVEGIVEKCNNYADQSGYLCSGIISQIGYNSSSVKSNVIIDSCINEGNLSRVGAGIVRVCFNDETVKIIKCINNGDLLGKYSAGIIQYGDKLEISECYNNGSIISVECSGIFGFAGNSNNLIINKCYNDGVILGKNSGGIIGSQALGKIMDCINAGSVSGEGSGGICGAGCAPSLTIDNCINNGEIDGNNTGGIFGAWCQGTSENCINAGGVTGVSAGGIFGEFSNGINVNSVNYGNVSGINARSI
jgi:hypothetical protein